MTQKECTLIFLYTTKSMTQTRSLFTFLYIKTSLTQTQCIIKLYILKFSHTKTVTFRLTLYNNLQHKIMCPLVFLYIENPDTNTFFILYITTPLAQTHCLFTCLLVYYNLPDTNTVTFHILYITISLTRTQCPFNFLYNTSSKPKHRVFSTFYILKLPR